MTRDFFVNNFQLSTVYLRFIYHALNLFEIRNYKTVIFVCFSLKSYMVYYYIVRAFKLYYV